MAINDGFTLTPKIHSCRTGNRVKVIETNIRRTCICQGQLDFIFAVDIAQNQILNHNFSDVNAREINFVGGKYQRIFIAGLAIDCTRT